jgi:hypothetical protein
MIKRDDCTDGWRSELNEQRYVSNANAHHVPRRQLRNREATLPARLASSSNITLRSHQLSC